MALQTVEKIGGTTMSRFPELIEKLFKVEGEPRYERICVVSAFGGITDLLLSHKHSGEPGVFTMFSEGDSEDEWQARLDDLARHMKSINETFVDTRQQKELADSFVDERISDARECLEHVQHLCSFGPFALNQYLDRVRELLSSIGEAHSAFNATLLLKSRGVEARFVDLTGWRDNDLLDLNSRIQKGFEGIDLSRELPVVTGYAQCEEGLVKRYDRGYTEITMSKIATLFMPREAIIHKEYHLASADPKIVGVEESTPIGRTNYDVADQLANLGMEAIHPNAASMLRKEGIPLRVKHAFQPDNFGTLIDSDYRSEKPRVEIIAGRRGVMAIEIFDQDMIGEQMEYEERIIELLRRLKIKSIGKDINANSIVHYVAAPLKKVKRFTERISESMDNAEVCTRKVAFVCAIGTDMDLPGILARCAGALGNAGVAIRSVCQPLRGVDARFVVDEEDYQSAVVALHDSIIEESAPVSSAAQVRAA